jgi:SRSO17 transposase
MEKKGPVVAWIVDDTGFPKKGTHSVGVTRPYCGQVGKPENCRVAVSLSVATWTSSLPIAWRLYLPEGWARKGKREFLRKWSCKPNPRWRGRRFAERSRRGFPQVWS